MGIHTSRQRSYQEELKKLERIVGVDRKGKRGKYKFVLPYTHDKEEHLASIAPDLPVPL